MRHDGEDEECVSPSGDVAKMLGRHPGGRRLELIMKRRTTAWEQLRAL